jgi:general secretion pathway protein G
MKRRLRRGGFTLIELLLVVGILALLGALVVPNLMRAGDDAKIDITKSLVGRSGNISSNLEKYRFHIGRYPEADEGLAALIERPKSVDRDDERWRGPYVQGVDPFKDAWQNELNYKMPGEFNTDSFDLWSNGPDGKEGTEDDITNWSKK